MISALVMEVDEIAKFFTEFNVLEQRLRFSHVGDEQRQFLEFQKIFTPFDNQMMELRRLETPFYNVFEVLNVRHRETKLHTPFLVNLLDPKASHEQGSFFLDRFLASVLKLGITYERIQSFEIWEEHASQHGQIDILMTYRFEGRLKAIVIENKIYAGDQDQQLTRYYNYLTDDLRLEDKDILLVYLTTSGKIPSEGSMKLDKQKKLREGGSLKEIGYHSDILPWLTACRSEIKSPRLQQVLQQYIKTLKSL